VVRYDCRGFGASGPFDPAIGYTHAGDLLALLDHLGIGRAVLAGLSFGGRVVMQAALAAPERIAGAGHMINMERPAVLNELLIRFLDQLYPGPRPPRPAASHLSGTQGGPDEHLGNEQRATA
jgi:pimeloyl-ACP methyl ester carboxylesterase